VSTRAVTRIRASLDDRSHASAELTGSVPRKRNLHVLAVMTSALAQCTPWQRETNYDSTWVGSFCGAGVHAATSRAASSAVNRGTMSL
jgi:hypothetical protein